MNDTRFNRNDQAPGRREYSNNSLINKIHQGTMRDKLTDLKGNFRTDHHRTDMHDPHASPMKWKDDGIDHINILALGSTELGQALAHSSPISFKHSVFGHFKNMECFWHYIQSEEQDDRIRTMNSVSLKSFSLKLTPRRVTNFRAIIMDSNYQRIKQYPALVEAIKESVLPFECYYIHSETNLRTRPVYFKWFLAGFEEIRRAFKADEVPNFDPLKDVQNSDTYKFVRPPTSTQNSKKSKSSLLEKIQTDAETKAKDKAKAKEIAAKARAKVKEEIATIDKAIVEEQNLQEESAEAKIVSDDGNPIGPFVDSETVETAEVEKDILPSEEVQS